MQTILYIHGYGSTPNSEKVAALREHFDVIAPEVPATYDEASTVLSATILDALINSVSKADELILVGTSLGGYWASVMSEKFLLPAVIINPSCDPGASLAQKDNPTLTEEELKKYVPLDPKSGISRVVLLAKDDEILDYQKAKLLFTRKAKINLYENGGHRFNRINTIVDAITELSDGAFYLP